ncbi:helix-turn-helix transcriptional regulator [Pseudonocardia parietis]|uniref:DNA-binding CsgD family transcriptional regulator n=1 Tax=Pseudonocardia parietis TaxID=570936 RepID=A0ABS4W421_9PSEU|nr:LuxR family transcriptional regulator [Pseudonocardia parietis]MBP2370970.1 DNA-binding CsgD family transcriptional regulator [Pseudonocardia parietis]
MARTPVARTTTSSGPRHDGPPPVLGGDPPLVGRETEIAVLHEVLADPGAPGLLLSGPLGVGRTRLLREAVRIARGLGRRAVLVTGTGAGVPLGPLAHVVPPVPGDPDGFARMQHALVALRGDGDHPVVAVDDAHRLDDLTRVVLVQLALAGDATVIATERSDRAPDDRLRTLGDDVRPLAVAPLTGSDTDRLLRGMLGGDVEARTAQRMRDLVHGTPLFLRELVRDGYENGRLTRHAGPWRWDGPLEPPNRLGAFLLAGLGADERELLEQLACGVAAGPAGSVGRDVFATLHRRQLIRTDRDGQVAVPPFVAAVVAGTAAPVALAGGGPDPIATAARANRELDHQRAERIARRALDDDPDAGAHLELVEALRWQDRVDELRPLLDATADRVRTAEGRARLALTRALLARRAGESALAAAETALDTEPDGAAPPASTGPGRIAAVAVLEAAARLDGLALPRTGYPDRTSSGMRDVPATADAGAGAPAGQDLPEGPWKALAAASRAGRLAATGRPAEALDAVARARSALDEDPAGQAESALTRLLLIDAELSALRVAGRSDDLERAADDAHRRNLAAPDWAGDAWIAWHCGRAALVRGDLDAAGRWLAEARAGTARRDPLGLAADCTATLALVRVLSGDHARARSLLAGLSEPVPLAARAAVERARTWLRAGRTAAAPVGALLTEARAAASRGDLVTEAVLLHDVARLGWPGRVADRLAAVAARSRSPLLHLFAAHAAASTATTPDTGARLDRVAADLAAAGVRLDAADVAAAAAAAHHRAGERRRSAASAARATELAGSGGTRTPALDRLVRPRLTPREREIAALAAEGASNAEVAHRLVVSVRTIETHLAHAYAKLGVDGRADLLEALPAALEGAAGR